VLGVRVVLAVVFALAGAAKLFDRPGSRRSLSEFGVPGSVVPIAAVLLPLLELATAVALIPPASARWAGLAGLVLLLGFMGGIVNANLRGRAPDCHCFGQLHSAPAGREALARNGVLAALAAVVIWQGPGPSISAWVSARTPAELVAVGAVAMALVMSGVAVRLWLERRRLRDDLADALAQIAALPRGLPVGATAPAFALPDLHGRTQTLESLRARKRPLVLVFVAPGCGPCKSILAELASWQTTLADRLTVAVISQGTVAENRPFAEEHGIANLLLQENWEVTRAYRIPATPAALVVTPDQAIGSSVVGPGWAIEPLIRLALRRGPMVAAASPASAEQPLT
jgi:peroxiredoxin/uncharacterized membrane protein YphA (DoxX/SURF4 family)